MNDVADPAVSLGPTLERLRRAWLANKPSLEQRHADLGRLRHLLARGGIGDRVELLAHADAHRALESRKTTGATVLVP